MKRRTNGRPGGSTSAGTSAGTGPWWRRRLMQARAWAADYAYVAYWQVRGFLFRKDPAVYLAPSKESAAGSQRCPVILIPGVYENWQFLRPLAEALSARGHPVHTVAPLGYNRGRIDRMAVLVQEYLVEHDLSGVVAVAHSKGGLIGKQLMLLPEGGRRVDRMVAVNTPFSGSVYANFFVLPSIRAFAPRNKFLRRLQESSDINARITSVYSRFDPHIPGGSHLPGARNIRLETMGHFRPIGDPRLLAVLEQELDGQA
ncbi:alpha/beta hydrolase [Arthrobacter sp. zg-Y1219]|uniref:esterase/lipase family protein n=1 Tax=Arthrobacter sp. zg-Y1219 TaxID=3049067 RepID=UPI0024C2BBA5|nr:alpha/beta hydrolase [Arthrobacter sp. zg-Y1219]MDK1359823.1 alpha/beta hydrolase [Arthrobacter sp. zg-Y1219]